MTKLLTKAQVEKKVFTEKKGMVNIYSCGNCRKTVMYFYVDSGETPLRITCVSCGADSFSQLSAMHQPERFWYRPKNLAELKVIVDMAYEFDKEEYQKTGESERDTKIIIMEAYIKYYNKGGLFAQTIEKE